MPQTHQQPAEGPDDASQTDQDRREDQDTTQPSLLGPKGDPAEGKTEVGPKPN